MLRMEWLASCSTLSCLFVVNVGLHSEWREWRWPGVSKNASPTLTQISMSLLMSVIWRADDHFDAQNSLMYWWGGSSRNTVIKRCQNLICFLLPTGYNVHSKILPKSGVRKLSAKSISSRWDLGNVPSLFFSIFFRWIYASFIFI